MLDGMVRKLSQYHALGASFVQEHLLYYRVWELETKFNQKSKGGINILKLKAKHLSNTHISPSAPGMRPSQESRATS
jgi:hypothetical protein